MRQNTEWARDTIAAIATPRGMGGIAVVKISGDGALEIAGRCLSGRGARRLRRSGERSVFVDRVIVPESTEMVDEVIVLVMRGPRSYTGEDVVEIQCHGGELVAEKVLDVVLSCGARIAEPGEFTRRAFLNGRITLDEAEAVLDVVTAKTERALRQAVLRLEGQLGRSIQAWRAKLSELYATLQASLDFPEDVSLPERETAESLRAVKEEIDRMVQGGVLGVALASGVQVALIGKPNAGKSSLFNALLGEERAIVTEVPGTTRDVLRERVEWAGIPVVLVDTAGLRETRDVVEMIGVERARAAAEEAWAIVYVVDGARGITDEDWFWLERWRDRRGIVAVTKVDVADEQRVTEMVREVESRSRFPVVPVASHQRRGIEDLRQTIVQMFGAGEREDLVPGSARQVSCLRRASEALGSALEAWTTGWTVDVVACAVEEACRALDELTGSRISEDVLDEIFSRFCVGK